MSALMLMDSDIRSHFGIPPITDTVAPTDHHLSLETLDAEPGILYVAREDIRTLPLAKPLQIMPGETTVVPVDPEHDFLRSFGDRMRLSGRSGLTQAGTDTRVFFSGGQPYARITNHGHSILGEEEGTAIDLGATFVNSSIPTHGANLETLVAEITYHENPERPWRVISARESGLPYDGVAMPVERVFRSFVEQRNGSNHPDRCLKMSLIPSGTKRRALYDHIGLDPEPIHVHGDRPRDAASQAVLNKKQGLVISASQAVELPQSTGLVIQHAVYEDADGKRLITHLNSPLLKSHNRRGFAYTHTIMYETDGTPTYVIGYAFDRFSYA